MKTLKIWIICLLLPCLITIQAQEDELQNPRPETTEHRFPESTQDGKRITREKTFDSIVEKMETNRVRIEEINKQTQEMQVKGVPMSDSKMQKLLREKLEIEKNDKQLEEDIKNLKN